MQKPSEITSKSNPRIKDYLKLKKRSHRYERKRFLGEGIQLLKEALAGEVPVEALFLTGEGEARCRDLAGQIAERCGKVYRVTPEVMAALTSTVTPQGIVAVLPFTHEADGPVPEGSHGPLAFLDKVRDPGNLGTMIRAADAAGMESVLVSKGSADIYNPKTARASAGSLFHLPIRIDLHPGETLRGLKGSGWEVVGADPRAEESLWDHAWNEKTVIILGNEAWGIPPEDQALVDCRVSIPIYGRAESLNVAAAAALMFYEIRRRAAGG